MARLMSVALTAQAVRERRKLVTRRLGWWEDRAGRRLTYPGDRLTLCPKVQGRRRPDGTVEPLERIVDVELVSVRREPLNAITPEDVVREGFPGWTPGQFVAFFCEHMKKATPETIVTRLEWIYLDGDEPVDGCMAETANHAAAGVR